MKKPAKTPTDRPGKLEQRFTSLLTRLLRVSKQEIQDHERTSTPQIPTPRPKDDDH